MPRMLAAALLCLGLAAPALAQNASDAPVATSLEARARQVSPPTAERMGAPTDDYGYVAWCYGAVSGYVDQYETAMPEVIRIERAFPTPSTEENIAKIYPEQRDIAVAQLATFRDAMTAAEKASPRSLAGPAQLGLTRGRSIWSGSTLVTKAQLAQFWMGWTPPAECDTRAKGLLAKSALFGQALSFNARPVAEPAPPAEQPASDTVLAEATSAAVAEPAAEAPAAVEAASEATAAPAEAKRVPNIDDLLASPVGGPVLRGAQ